MSLERSVRLKMGEASEAPQNGDSLIDCLPDEILVEILSRMRLKEAGRTSVLSRRWRYLWSYSRSLCFNPAAMGSAWANRVLELHQAPQLDKFVVHFSYNREDHVWADEIDGWLDFAMRKQVQEMVFAVSFLWPRCEIPIREKYAFGRLRSLRLKFVHVKDEVVHNILASCPYLEAFILHCPSGMRNLQFFDPLPNLKHLELVHCHQIESVEISATSLVYFHYGGARTDRLLFKNIPNLPKVSLGGGYASSFIYEGDRHSSYSAQLVKIALRIGLYGRPNLLALPRLDSLKRLELYIHSQVGESLLFFILSTKAAPLLCQFKIRFRYEVDYRESSRLESSRAYSSYPEVCAAGSATFSHENLKLVEMAGYIGCPSEEEFLLQLCKMAPSIENVVVNTSGSQFDIEPVPYHEDAKETGALTRAEAVERAKNLKFTSLLGAGGNMVMSSTETKVIWQVETNGKTSNEPTQNTNLNTSYVAGIKNAESNQLS